jgi:molecular chaperone DnaK
MQIIPSSGLADEEVDRMVQEAERHQEEDRKRREEVEARNMGDNAVYSAEKFLREQEDNVPADLRSDTETKIEALKNALQGSDANAIRRCTDELSQALQQIGASMYQGTGAAEAPPPPGGEPPTGGDEDVIEGEFSEA